MPVSLKNKAAALLRRLVTRWRALFKRLLVRLRSRPTPGETGPRPEHVIEETVATTVEPIREPTAEAPHRQPSEQAADIAAENRPEAVVVEHAGSASAAGGRLRMLPWLTPKRDYLLLSASQRSANPRRLLVLLHGCKQNPEDFSRSTHIRALAADGDWLVLLPRQSKRANLYHCWNWFDLSVLTGGGEVAIVLAALEQVRHETGIASDACFLAGMSSGAALAAAIACHAPEQFAGAAFHAGVPMGAVASPSRARQVMGTEPDRDVTLNLPRKARLPAMVVQGTIDDVVAPVHGRELMRQMLALNNLLTPGAPLPAGEPLERSAIPEGQYPALVRSFGESRLINIEGLGHAWSGGDEQWPFNDARGPNATAMMIDFFEHIQPGLH